ncbi:hypothetical protein [Mycobacterium sp. Root135]|uniref:hypothetical protein n=1 Tax=Mycobacterium sp. Root135 TaxID=1736457 RepID=UPI0012E9AB56|nr:hypothetical protein [Mycobacterium sp. Root135]
MSDLLGLAIKAHGGLRRWDELTSATGRFAIGGAIWGFKGVPGVLADITVDLELRSERVTLKPVGGVDTHTAFTDGRLELRSTSGNLVAAVDDPKDAMARLPYDAPWTAMDAAYFASEAWWTYLTAPFLFTYNGFEVEEVQPFVEAGVSYRTLKVAFPGRNRQPHRRTVLSLPRDRPAIPTHVHRRRPRRSHRRELPQ